MSLRRAATSIALTVVVTVAVSMVVPRAQSRTAALAISSAGSDLRAWDQSIDRMSRTGELRLRRSDVDPLLPSRTHQRLDQYYKGVKVLGGDVARQLENALTVSVFGNVYQDIELDVDAALSVEAAAAIIKADCGASLGGAKLPVLLILPEADGYRLVYHAKAFTLTGGFEYFIDAATGAVVKKLDAVQRQSIGLGTGVLSDTKKMSATPSSGTYFADDALRPPRLVTFDMKGNVQRTVDFLNGFIALGASDRAADTDNRWTDTAVVDAHAYAGYTYDYFYARFGRRGLDNNNLRILSLVHPAHRADVFSYPPNIQNAFYINAGYYGDGVMLYGEGLPAGVTTTDGKSWNYLSGSLDVIGHELAHGVTDYTSNLIYQGESGALNEAFSDIMGTSIEFYYQPTGTGSLRADYLLGEDVVTPGGLRSMANPQAYGDPDHYSRRYIGPQDNGGVHINSGIANQAFYLAIEGGTNRTSGLAVTGVGATNREQMERVFYRAFTLLLPANASFAQARAATVQVARELYGAGGAVERAVTQAWTAVGVN